MVDAATAARGLPIDPAERFEFWAAGLPHELRFWMDWAATRGGRWPDEFAQRMNPQTPLVPWLAQWAVEAKATHLRVLDVGAGPVTSLGYVPPQGMTLELVATDPLADAYAEHFHGLGLVPPTTTRFALAEELTAFLPAEFFDIVHCRNALDCCFDPRRALGEMLRVLRPGGVIMLYNLPNQAVAEGYAGSRQYNLDVANERLVVWRGSERWDVETALPVRASIKARGGEQVSAIITKQEAFAPERAGWFGIRRGEAWRARVGRAIRRRLPA